MLSCMILAFGLSAPIELNPLTDEELLPKDPKERLLWVLNSREFPRLYLRELLELAPKQVPELIRLLESESLKTYSFARATIVIPKLGDQRFQFVPLVKARLLDKQAAIRLAAIECMKEFQGPEYRAVILPLIADPDWTTACAAGRAMAEVGTFKELRDMRNWIEQQGKLQKPHDATPEIKKYADLLEGRLKNAEKPANK